MILSVSPMLLAYILVLTIILGGAMGSFAACMASRLVSGETFLYGRSHCDSCGHDLTGRDLIPILSWVILKGKCRWCKKKISPRSSLIELLCALAFVGLIIRYDISFVMLQYMILTVLLLTVSLVDYDTGLIPDGLLVAMIITWIVFIPIVHHGQIQASLIQGIFGAILASVPLLILTLVMDRVLQKESMGGGDIKLFFAVGLFFSWQSVLFLLILSCLLGILFGICFNKRFKDKKNPQAFPFGPAIGVGVYLSLFIAEPVMGLYLNLF